MTSPTLSQATIEVLSGPHAGRTGILVQDRLRSMTLRDEQGKFDVWKKDVDTLIPVSEIAKAVPTNFTADGVEIFPGAVVAFRIGSKQMTGEVTDTENGRALIDTGKFELVKAIRELVWIGQETD